MLSSQISNEGIEDDEWTISMVEDVISMSQIFQQSFQPLLVEEEALTIDNDLQAPQDSSGIANVATPNKEPSRKVIDNRETLLLAMIGFLLIVGFLDFMSNQSVAKWGHILYSVWQLIACIDSFAGLVPNG